MLQTLRHCWEVMRASLAEEKSQPKKATKNTAERAFQPHAIEILDTPASPAGRATVILIIALFVIAIVWAFFGKIDVHATASGKIIPAGYVKVVEPLESGKVRAIHVKSGDEVKAGDILLELDPTETTADLDRLTQELVTAQLEASRIAATIDAASLEDTISTHAYYRPAAASSHLVRLQLDILNAAVRNHFAQRERVDADITQRQAERMRLESSVVEREKLVSVLEERVNSTRRMAAKRIGTRTDFLQSSQLMHEEAAVLAAEKGQILEVDAAVDALNKERKRLDAELLSQLVAELSEKEKEVAALQQEIIKAKQRNDRSRLAAPVDGVVQQLMVHTIGDVVTTGEQLMIVVPVGAHLEAEVMVLNKDKGFVSLGDDVEVKVEAFPFTKYGTVPGTLTHLSNDAIAQEDGTLQFPGRVSMAREVIWVDGRKEPLTPGMSVTAEVKTGQRRIIEYLLTPLLRYRDEAIRER